AAAAPKAPEPPPVPRPAPRPVEGAPEGVTRRAQPRVAMQAQVDLQGDSNLFSGFSTNLSEGGLFVATVNLLPLGTEVDLAFTLAGGETIKTHAVVRWRREVSDLQPDQMPGLGLQFVNLDEAAQKAIIAFIEQREPLFWAE
ncbi:MAG: TIGR02266 family protein, partial [Myxococcaceae bacterium]|nr:TIGR02266 family protein [Myxococcaceae bacterium]